VNAVAKLRIIVARIKLTTTHVFLLPYEGMVYFSIRGAAINLKLKGRVAKENNASMS
jgi:hypothetical protein